MSVATALQDFDILCAIFEEFAVERHERRQRPARRRDLARSARVCKAFTEPALRVLWRVLPGVEPLLRLLSCVRKVEQRDRAAQFLLQGALCSKEWRKFQDYAERIRVMDQWDTLLPDRGRFYSWTRAELKPVPVEIEPVLQQFFSLSNGGRPLLPYIQRLSWETASPNPVCPPPLLFIGPSIQRLSLRHDPSSEGRSHSLESFLTAISSLVLGLHTLTVYEQLPHWGTTLSPDLASAYESALLAVSGCVHLRRLKIAGRRIVLSRRFLHTLSSLPLLESLRLQVARIDVNTDVEQKRVLAAMETLELTAPGNVVADFYKLAFVPRIRKLSLTFANMYPDGGRALISAFPRMYRVRQLPTTLWASTLRILHLSFCTARNHIPQQGFLMPFVQPFLNLQNVEQFTVIMDSEALSWSDDDALTISQCWPKLTAFLVRFEDMPSNALLQPSSRALLHFAEHCPDLKQLVIPYVADADVDHLSLPNPRPHRHLEVLLLNWVHVKCKGCFARYLVRLFPHLRVDGRAKDCVRFPFHKDYDHELWRLLRKQRE
ncbi:uncharacterized protein B0H18DRAFT_1010658 [Fomitopsis serialis]|uniref:uncharacterized protein n=1 Tax=Fomitopsis serialis TaxID=139415 RepID=UPI00200833D1|nr:uncharacterized protein B0H18DRAFT_1010658 [Neoantrodia serialis]KAH9924897.1 hypothetical protein B0H18DRAFT_1010658 [Neoantrodia serialis]